MTFQIPLLISACLVPGISTPLGAHPPADTVRAEVAARIDGSGAAPTGFEFLEALAVDGRGSVYALDGAAHRVSSFDAAGRHRWSLGRKGRGPGEFESPVGLAFAPNGDLWVIDPETQRATIVSTAGRLLDTRMLLSGFVLSPWPGRFDRDGRLLHYSAADTPGYDYSIGVFDQALNQLEKRATPTPPEPLQYFEGTTERGSHLRTLVPYTPQLIWRLDSRGRFVSLWTAQATFSRNGRPLAAIATQNAQGPAVTPPERREAIASLERFTRRGGRVEPSRIPDRKPVLSTFVLDEADRIWAVRSRTANERETRFDVFDAEGRFQRHVVVSAVLQSFPTIIVRDGWIAGVERDDDGVETIVLSRVP